jgi:hypothetical protein
MLWNMGIDIWFVQLVIAIVIAIVKKTYPFDW